ncbi:MAG: response regulator transcription factor [Chloroflexota bacterium]|nr:response regulator transcription factor [Chloroflexota bacterium]
MNAVLIVSGQPDLLALTPELEEAGLSTTVLEPARLGEIERDFAGVLLLDLRDLSNVAIDRLAAASGEHELVLVHVCGADQLDRMPFDSPADDFIVLPAAPGELRRRVERALYRRHGIDTENFVRCGALTIDLANYRVTVASESVVLTFKEYELLRYLAMNAGRVSTREQLLNRVWGYDYFGGARTVDVHIRRIRSKIEIHGHTFIETVRNVGYRLVASG